jgi:hypothetical protein
VNPLGLKTFTLQKIEVFDIIFLEIELKIKKNVSKPKKSLFSFFEKSLCKGRYVLQNKLKSKL